jgi:hypothetical protein
MTTIDTEQIRTVQILEGEAIDCLGNYAIIMAEVTEFHPG